MPTVIVAFGLTIKRYVRDEHPPPHVHVHGSDWEIRVLIGESAAHGSIVSAAEETRPT